MRSLFLILIILWIPLQGAFAAAFPLCSHEENTAHNLNSAETQISDTHLNIVVPKQLLDNDMTLHSVCESYTLCHVSCSTVITSTCSTTMPTNIASYTISLFAKSSSFIPEQLQRPPLA